MHFQAPETIRERCLPTGILVYSDKFVVPMSTRRTTRNRNRNFIIRREGVIVRKIDTKQNPADLLTKPLEKNVNT